MAVNAKSEATSLGTTYHLQALTNTLQGKHDLEGGVRKAVSPLIETILIKQTRSCPSKEMTAHDLMFQELFVSVVFFKIQILSLEENVSHTHALTV